MPRITLKRFFITTASALAFGAVASFAAQAASEENKNSSARTPGGKPALTVTAARPRVNELPVRITANGDIAAWQEASIGAEADNWRLDSVRVNVGDVVEKGQVLATFAQERVRADLAQAEAALAEAEANAAEASANAERARSLQANHALSAQQIDQLLTAARAAQARVEVARAAVTVQQVRLQQTQVLAPDSGVISARMATLGAVVGPGTELFRLIRQGRLEWRAEVTAAELGRVKPGATAILVAANGARVKGRVRTLAPAVDTQTRAALVYVDLPARAPVKAGMFAEGHIELGASRALTVPWQAVVARDGFDYVFRLNSDGHVAQARVETGRRLDDRVEIRGGIAADDKVVTSGAGFLNDGDLVKEVPAASGQAPL